MLACSFETWTSRRWRNTRYPFILPGRIHPQKFHSERKPLKNDRTGRRSNFLFGPGNFIRFIRGELWNFRWVTAFWILFEPTELDSIIWVWPLPAVSMTIQVYYLFGIEDSSRNPSWKRGKKVTHILHSGVYPSSTNSQLPSPKLTANAPENGWLDGWKTILSFGDFPYFQGLKTVSF